MNLGVEGAGELFDAVGLLGFVLWLVFIASASTWLLRRPAGTPLPEAEPVRAV